MKRRQFLAEHGTLGKNQSEQYQALNEGGVWNTWAHWALAIEYAEDLSTEMWFWAKSAVREKMESHGLSVNVAAQAAVTMSRADLLALGKRIEIEPRG